MPSTEAILLTLLALAGSDGYEISDFSYRSDRLSFRSVTEPAELALERLVRKVGEDAGVTLEA